MVAQKRRQSRWAVKTTHYTTASISSEGILYCGRVPSEAAIVPIKAFQVLLSTSQVLQYTGCKWSSHRANKSISGTSLWESCVVVVQCAETAQVKQGRRWVLTRLLQCPGSQLAASFTGPTHSDQTKQGHTNSFCQTNPPYHHKYRPQYSIQAYYLHMHISFTYEYSWIIKY